jgi:hypothetical protein
MIDSKGKSTPYTSLDIGAQYIEGSVGNPIFSILSSIDEIENETLSTF